MAAKNPLLDDQAIQDRFELLPKESKLALADFCAWLYHYAAKRAETAWSQKKAPMAVYWAAVKAWAFHLARILRKKEAG